MLRALCTITSIAILQSRFNRLLAVQVDGITRFQVGRTQTVVQIAATLPEKLKVKPAIRPLVDWCVAWIQRRLTTVGCSGLTFGEMITAYNAANARTPDLYGGYTLKSLLTNCNICMAMLVAYARDSLRCQDIYHDPALMESHSDALVTSFVWSASGDDSAADADLSRDAW
jgi:hypothetical protein